MNNNKKNSKKKKIIIGSIIAAGFVAVEFYGYCKGRKSYTNRRNSVDEFLANLIDMNENFYERGGVGKFTTIVGADELKFGNPDLGTLMYEITVECIGD